MSEPSVIVFFIFLHFCLNITSHVNNGIIRAQQKDEGQITALVINKWIKVAYSEGQSNSCQLYFI